MKQYNKRLIKTPEELGYILRKLRRNKKIKRSEIAEKLKIDIPTYTYYESGSITPPVFILIKLSEIFDVEVTTLFFVDVVEYQMEKSK